MNAAIEDAALDLDVVETPTSPAEGGRVIAEPYSPTPLQLFRDKGISPGLAFSLGVREEGDDLVYTATGRRRSLNGGGRKHRQPRGVPLEPWTLISADNGSMIICEGETDALAAATALGTMPPVEGGDPGILSVPGTGCTTARVIDAIREAGVHAPYIAVDNDEAGNKFAIRLAQALADAGMTYARLELPPGADLAEVLAGAGDPGRALAGVLRAATRMAGTEDIDLSPPDNGATAQPPIDRDAEWAKCQSLAAEPRILDRFTKQLVRAGLVGEDKLAKIIYLTTTSRMLPKPVSVAVKGPSAGGKSYTVEVVLDHFPGAAFYALSAMSERALAYSEESLEHRMLVIYEAAGMESDFASYLLRSLLSEGCVRYETVEKTKEGMRARLIERPGPTGLIVTTTRTRLHPENETRVLSMTVKDTPEQTREVMRAIAEEDEPDLDLEPWHALQVWLEPRRVTIPYGKQLAELIPAVAVRLRRDFGSVLGLIRAHALLHQATRAEDEQGRIIATIEDYAVVRELVSDLVASGVGAGVSKETRETVEAVDRLASDEGITQKTLANELGLDKSAVSRRVAVATRDGYLRNLEDRRGRPARLIVGDPLPDQMEILPAPSELADGCTVAPVTEGDNQARLAIVPEPASGRGSSATKDPPLPVEEGSK